MHEMALVRNVVDIVVEQAEKSGAAEVKTVYLTIGQGRDVVVEYLDGLFQFLALVPGTSRSGATILGAMLIGCSRTVAAEFTFFLAVPTMAGASLVKVVKFLADGGGFSGSEVGILLTGCAVAFAVSMLCIRFLMNYVKKHDFKVFGWYRIGLGALVLAYFYLLKPAL